jgi:hypothetical protein
MQVFFAQASELFDSWHHNTTFCQILWLLLNQLSEIGKGSLQKIRRQIPGFPSKGERPGQTDRPAA